MSDHVRRPFDSPRFDRVKHMHSFVDRGLAAGSLRFFSVPGVGEFMAGLGGEPTRWSVARMTSDDGKQIMRDIIARHGSEVLVKVEVECLYRLAGAVLSDGDGEAERPRPVQVPGLGEVLLSRLPFKVTAGTVPFPEPELRERSTAHPLNATQREMLRTVRGKRLKGLAIARQVGVDYEHARHVLAGLSKLGLIDNHRGYGLTAKGEEVVRSLAS